MFSPGRSLRSRYLGFGFRQSSGNVPDEWVCSFQSSGRDKKDLSLYLPLSERSNNPIYSKKVFQLFEYPVFPLVDGLLRNAQGLCHFALCFFVKEQDTNEIPFFFGKLHKRGM